MKILVHNPSSPGASFTENTNSVLLEINEWIACNQGKVLPFIDFRHALVSDKGLNDNNNRNIFPLLRNCGFVKYGNSDLIVDNFYTNRGKAFIEVIKLLSDLECSEIQDEKTVSSIKKLKVIVENMIFWGLCNLMEKSNASYKASFHDTIIYLCNYGKIDKKEFAFLMDERLKHNDILDCLESMKNNIDSYRQGSIDIEVDVEVRNDTDIREVSNKSQRKEGIAFLTAFGYYVGMLSQAGLILKERQYFIIKPGRELKLKELGDSFNG